ncbi:MAG: hypothetical protein L0191_02860 [Acidobacteria bacterium]|nr:hypothetical protein [Acidobacteriota bacterium]
MILEAQRLLGLLTALNLGLLWYQSRPALQTRAADPVPDVIRAHALEIVDAQGRFGRASRLLPEDPKVLWKGKPYPETVLLRLITADGRPNVKLGAGKSGSGLLIAGESDPTYVQVLAEGAEPRVKLSGGDGRERVIEP